MSPGSEDLRNLEFCQARGLQNCPSLLQPCLGVICSGVLGVFLGFSERSLSSVPSLSVYCFVQPVFLHCLSKDPPHQPPAFPCPAHPQHLTYVSLPLVPHSRVLETSLAGAASFLSTENSMGAWDGGPGWGMAGTKPWITLSLTSPEPGPYSPFPCPWERERLDTTAPPWSLGTQVVSLLHYPIRTSGPGL